MRARFLLPMLLALPLRPALAASTLLVPQQFPTIQEAVAAAIDGDTILVKAGVYAEQVTLSGLTDVTLRGQGKVIVDAGGAGAGLLLNLCSGCTIERIRVQAADVGILLLTCGHVTLTKCRVEGSLSDGIRLDGCEGLVIRDCVVSAAGDDGIAVGAGTANPTNTSLLLHNTISDAVHAGIAIDGSSNTVAGNVVSRSGFADYAIVATTAGSGNIFRGNTSVDCGDDAFSIHGNACVVTDNRVVSSEGHGIALLDGDGVLVSGNTVVKAGGAGIFCDSDVAGVVVSGNSVSKASDAGIALLCDGFLLVDNVSKGAGDDGYQLVGNGGTVIGNRATGNTEAGFILVGNGHLLSGNVGKGNGTVDLEVQGSGNLVDATNVFKTTGP